MPRVIMEDGTILEGAFVELEETDELEELLSSVDELIDEE